MAHITLVSLAVTSAVSAASGILGFAATTGFVRGAYVYVVGVASAKTGVLCIITNVGATTLTLGATDPVTGKVTGKNAVLTGFTAGDYVTQPEQYTNVDNADIPVAPVVVPIATATVLGGVKQGAGVTISAAGVLSVP
jgi:hypothetical protein